MTTPKQPLVVPKEMPPQASNDHLAKRDRMIGELEKAAKESTGTLQQVLRKMSTMMTGTKPGMPYNPQAMQDVKDAFSRYASDKDTAAVPPPAILMEAVDWMQTYLAQRGFPVAEAAGGAPAAPAASTERSTGSRPGLPTKGSKDGFDSGGARSHAQSLGGETPVTPSAPKAQPAPAQPPAQKPQDLDSMKETLKNWQLNTHLGKVKG